MDYEKIEAYCKGELNGEDRKAFEIEMEKNGALKQEVAFFRDNIQLLAKSVDHARAKDELKGSLNKNAEIYFAKEKKGKVIPIKRWVAAAASFAAILLLSVFLWPKGNLYESYAQHAHYSFQQKGDGIEELNLAAVAFNNENYEGALKHFQEFSESHPEDQEVQFAIAICQLETNEINTALHAFKNQFNESVFREKAEWYEALCLLKLDRVEELQEHLSHISSSSSFYADAQKLLKDLR